MGENEKERLRERGGETAEVWPKTARIEFDPQLCEKARRGSEIVLICCSQRGEVALSGTAQRKFEAALCERTQVKGCVLRMSSDLVATSAVELI